MLVAGFCWLSVLASSALAQSDVATPYDQINSAAAASPITTLPVGGGVSILQGSGGNIGVLNGPEGLLMVDCGIPVSQQKILAALRGGNKGRLRFAVLTHWHWDHADGDGWVRRKGAQLIASAATVKRLSQAIRVEEWGHTFAPVPPAELPDVPLSAAKTLHFAGDEVIIRPYMTSHTDGDLSVYFKRADVLQTGDTFWNGMYPFIDYVAGGSIDGMIAAANENVRLVGPHSRIIPGHGPIASKADLVAMEQYQAQPPQCRKEPALRETLRLALLLHWPPNRKRKCSRLCNSQKTEEGIDPLRVNQEVRGIGKPARLFQEVRAAV
ncbi:MBL fold metallo-hydrolase [Novosphingobium sediminis]|nr:MBL fold metallo-hydrolase [Novosphingobium sediminis]